MYNAVDIRFLPLRWEKGFSSKEKDILNKFDIFFDSKKEKKCRKVREGVYKWRVIDASRNTDDIFEYLQTLKQSMHFTINAYTKYEDSDFESAEAFLIRFEKRYEYYDDDKYDSFQLICRDEHIPNSSCKVWEHIEPVYAKQTAALRKNFELIAGATNYEFSQASIISEKAYHYLTENHVSSGFFSPVFNKKGEQWAYLLNGQNAMLDSRSLQYNFYTELKTCPVCGRNVWQLNENMLDSFADAFGEQVVLGNPYYKDHWTLDKNAIEKLQLVNLTTDYFRTHQLTIINREMFHLIKRKVPSVCKNSIPIFER